MRIALGIAVGVLAACGSKKKDEAAPAATTAPLPPGVVAAPDGCPETAPAPARDVDPALRQVEPWSDALDAVVLTTDDVARLILAHGGDVLTGPPPLTRRGWLEAALALVGTSASPDPLAGPTPLLGLPAAGSFTIDLGPVTAADERVVLIEAAARAGVVLLEAGDHRQVWLGRDPTGTPRVIHAVADYAAPCATPAADGRAETRMQVGEVVLDALDVAALSRIVVFAARPGVELSGVVSERPAVPVTPPAKKQCDDSKSAAIFFSPARPSQEQELRVIATLSADPGPVELVLIDPAGQRHAPQMLRMGGPPFSYVIRVDAPAAGDWTAVLGDGTRVDACAVAEVSKKKRPRRGGATAWAGKKPRSEATENLYAAFVQQLFNYPVDQDLTWPNLHTLLQDREHNLLFDHLALGEDQKLVLDPDCADLPYLLQAYFAWKMDLPYGFYVCSRSGKSAPRCKTTDEDRPPGDNLIARADFKKQDDVGIFQEFARRVFRGVSSSSGRTGPKDSLTDWYPVPLTHEALRPGTLYADPYGHLMVMVGWYPQRPGGYGLLMGADAQPDATIGRRRFWRGNYLFTADTSRAGAGFKAYRPRIKSGAALEVWDNKKLAKQGWWTPWSTQQYDGTTDEFYDRMEELINPRPLDAFQMQISLVDALQEAVVRRINSVDNGEKFMVTVTEAIDMPEGADIFLTTGPWEDYSTPARDHRILVAIDTVLGLADAVRRRPERYRLAAGDVEATVAKLITERDALLAARTFSYVRSDGAAQQLSLADVVARQAGFEIAYNPNDCIEHRWGAPEGSPEMTTCKRRAPAWQQERMETYRTWFAKRERPVD